MPVAEIVQVFCNNMQYDSCFLYYLYNKSPEFSELVWQTVFCTEVFERAKSMNYLLFVQFFTAILINYSLVIYYVPEIYGNRDYPAFTQDWVILSLRIEMVKD